MAATPDPGNSRRSKAWMRRAQSPLKAARPILLRSQAVQTEKACRQGLVSEERTSDHTGDLDYSFKCTGCNRERFKNNFFKPYPYWVVAQKVHGIPVLGYFFLVQCTRIDLYCSNFPMSMVWKKDILCRKLHLAAPAAPARILRS